MNSVLIVSKNGKTNEVLTDYLSKNNFKEIISQESASKARQLFLERDFDLCIICAPLKDEFGDKLAKSIAINSICQVILILNADIVYEILDDMADCGVIALAKPVSLELLLQTIRLANSGLNRLKQMQRQNNTLTRKLEEIKIVNKAKCVLIEKEGLSEEEAHKKLEKLSMNERKDKKEISIEILKKYGKF